MQDMIDAQADGAEEEARQKANEAVGQLCGQIGERIADAEKKEQNEKQQGWKEWVNNSLEGGAKAAHR